LPGSSQARLDLLEAEDTVGNAVALATTLTENLCTWWIGTIRERMLAGPRCRSAVHATDLGQTFRYPYALTLSQIAASEHALSGSSIVYTGFASRVFATMNIQAIVYSTYVYQPVERLLYATRASAKTRNFFRQAKRAIKSGYVTTLPFWSLLTRLVFVWALRLSFIPSFTTLLCNVLD
jgi:hypothetical protein